MLNPIRCRSRPFIRWLNPFISYCWLSLLTSQEEQDWYICSTLDQRNTRCSGYESIWEGFSSVSGWFGKRLRLSQTIWRRQRSHMEADPAGTAVLAITRLNSLKRLSKPCDSSDQIVPCPYFEFYFLFYYTRSHFKGLHSYRNHRIRFFILLGLFFLFAAYIQWFKYSTTIINNLLLIL